MKKFLNKTMLAAILVGGLTTAGHAMQMDKWIGPADEDALTKLSAEDQKVMEQAGEIYNALQGEGIAETRSAIDLLERMQTELKQKDTQLESIQTTTEQLKKDTEQLKKEKTTFQNFSNFF